MELEFFYSMASSFCYSQTRLTWQQLYCSFGWWQRELRGLAEIYQEIFQATECLENIIIDREGPSVFRGL